MIKRKKVFVVFGTRPEAIKMCPLVLELKRNKQIETKVIVTGQHKEMLKQVLDIFNVQTDFDLEIMKENQTLADITCSCLNGLYNVFSNEKPDLILVHGDTTTAFSGALAAFYLKIPVCHVEAGLRTNDIFSPFPEEFNRRVISLISTLNFAPTLKSKDNLLQEGVEDGKILITGNTVIDAFKYTVCEKFFDENIKWVGDSKFILFTCHRRENFGEPMKKIFQTIKQIAVEEKIKVIYPVHLNPNIRKLAHTIFDDCDLVRMIEPLDVVAFHNYMKKSYLIVSDSGGIQEEAPSLGKPVLVTRTETERPEGVESGSLRLVGNDGVLLYKELKKLLISEKEYNAMTNIDNPYGDGHACEKIVKKILEILL